MSINGHHWETTFSGATDIEVGQVMIALTDKTGDWSNPNFSSGIFSIHDLTDSTKLVLFDLASISPASSSVLTVQDANGTIALLTNTLDQFADPVASTTFSFTHNPCTGFHSPLAAAAGFRTRSSTACGFARLGQQLTCAWSPRPTGRRGWAGFPRFTRAGQSTRST